GRFKNRIFFKRWKEKEEGMEEVKEILNVFTRLDGVNAVCLAGRDGFLVDSIVKKGIDSEMIGAIASGGFGSAESMGKQLDKGNLSMTMLEFKEGPIMLAPVGEDMFLVVAADENANLALIRLTIKRHKDKLAMTTAVL
ncbi:MAG: roadblock/LC7 domain-containing protein, partial [Thermodesulfovibrionia bacterium]|nr:roadblock/LC7 domain-containing protein [Thermodesulfovibrionia bacterium]